MELIRDFKTSFLKPAKYNPRIMDEAEHERLNEAIEYFGLVDPVIFNSKTGVIIGGNQRYEHIKSISRGIALILGDIGWYFTEDNLKLKSEADEKALNITLNKLSGRFDKGLLKPIVEEIIDTDVPLIPFTDVEVNDILEGFDDGGLSNDGVNESGQSDDGEYDKKELKHKGQTYYLKEGDVWNIGPHKLIVGEADETQDTHLSIKGTDLKITLSSTESIEEEQLLFIKHNKEVISNNKPKYGE